MESKTVNYVSFPGASYSDAFMQAARWFALRENADVSVYAVTVEKIDTEAYVDITYTPKQPVANNGHIPM